jgi:predicted RNase H-like HicB family nuclease
MPVFHDLQTAVEELKRNPSRPLQAQVDGLDIELRAISPEERLTDVRALLADLGPWEGESRDELLTRLREARETGRSAGSPLLERGFPPIRVAITSFAPEPYSLLQPIEILIEPVQDSFVASFFDANISASGDNQQEAFDNLKRLILDVYESLRAESLDRLGPEPKRQLAVIESFLRGRMAVEAGP